MLMLVLEKKVKHMKEVIRMKKEGDGEYKREEIDKKWGRFFQILRENSKERYTVDILSFQFGLPSSFFS